MKRILLGGVVSSLLVLSVPGRALSQLIPQPWVSVGANQGDVTFSIGARALGFGVELGRGPDDSTGVDALGFVNLPFVPVSPYVGLGYYTEDEGVAFSGGVQLDAADNLMLGVGYNSVRGVNGQVGVRF
ncbi:hypothetical protein IQ268_25910 [Oculatella sp. LEGE 06141]|uniref:hypothetical protein n=1 Tax=Oculatella sp. LEGE 06141 TaxID=1828648 RepID=UPI0018819BFA|nr:hypothetical protein [Oculatella sp. LEGE 06141]MBE9182008.1 hypothetical protein [Oculatella sp. LEGE 06141]